MKCSRQSKVAAGDILNEGLGYIPDTETLWRQGRGARNWKTSRLSCGQLGDSLPRTKYGGKPTIGPRSVGRVARFVLGSENGRLNRDFPKPGSHRPRFVCSPDGWHPFRSGSRGVTGRVRLWQPVENNVRHREVRITSWQLAVEENHSDNPFADWSNASNLSQRDRPFPRRQPALR
jgi:hypothetical protein